MTLAGVAAEKRAASRGGIQDHGRVPYKGGPRVCLCEVGRRPIGSKEKAGWLGWEKRRERGQAGQWMVYQGAHAGSDTGVGRAFPNSLSSVLPRSDALGSPLLCAAGTP